MATTGTTKLKASFQYWSPNYVFGGTTPNSTGTPTPRTSNSDLSSDESDYQEVLDALKNLGSYKPARSADAAVTNREFKDPKDPGD